MRRPSPIAGALLAVVVACLALAGPGCAAAESPSAAKISAVRCKPPRPAALRAGSTGPAFAHLSRVERRGRGLAVGIDGGWGGWGGCETKHRRALGAAITRHEWDLSRPVDAQDELVAKAAGYVHTRFHALLGANDLGDPAAYANFVVAFIERYGVGGSFWREHPRLNGNRYAIRTFELGNEPYFGEMSAEEYAAAVRPALLRVKKLGLPARIVLASRVEGTDASWMETLYREIPHLNSLYYAFAEHPYWYGHDPAEATGEGPFRRISILRQKMNARGAAEKPIFITEYGESTAECGGECVSERAQARHLRKMIRFCRRSGNGVELITIYQLLDRGTDDPDRELQFGILRQNGSPKPAYRIVREAARGNGR